jgi:alkylated DNA repair dioxygenase AlkB
MPPGDGWQRTRAPGLALRLHRAWLAPQEPLLERLLAEIPWRQDTISLFGRTHDLPRLTCWVADPGCSYTYSGLTNAPQPWSPLLLDLQERLNVCLGWRFNSVLLNRYRHGDDAMGWHADDEPELDAGAPIASLSLGASRSFRLRPRVRGAGAPDPTTLELAHGDLLVMDPPTQHHWLHALPPRRRVRQERVNLTFRRIGSQSAVA